MYLGGKMLYAWLALIRSLSFIKSGSFINCSVKRFIFSSEKIQQIQVLQNGLLKVLTKKHYMYSTHKLHTELKLLQVEDLVDQEILTFVFNYMNNKLPEKFDNCFRLRKNH